ncbi:hypothetical protein NSQ20_11840 [Paenibacillus sp. FSL K6-1122]|uniref:hypothetical protein n=1 Tax=Paenibacillus sp. FSL K6-1122 TaxID=2954512 RepID=UPI0030EBC812
MGMYTGLRCKVIVKPEFRQEFEFLNNEVQYEWTESNIDFLKEYGEYSRATFIPRGGLSYMPDCWEDVPKNENGDRDWRNASPTDGFNREFNKETGLWTFQCSLKNYESTIEYFLDNVLSIVVETIIHLEYYYEEWDKSIMFELIDGQITKSVKEGIKYNTYI